MPGHMPSQLSLTCATYRIGAQIRIGFQARMSFQTPSSLTGTIQDQTPAWMLAPRGARRPYLTDPPQRL